MMAYVVMALSGLAAVFYGLWQRSKVKDFKAAAEHFKEAFTASEDDRSIEHDRLENLVHFYRTRYEQAKEAMYAEADPAALRARLDAVLGGVPAREAPATTGGSVPDGGPSRDDPPDPRDLF